MADHEVDVSWGVTPWAHQAGYHEGVHQALQRWVIEDCPFEHPHFSNLRMP